MRVKELVSHDRWHETSEKDSRDKKWCIKPILLHEINLYLSEAIWHGDLGSEALPGGLAAITEVGHTSVMLHVCLCLFVLCCA